MSERVTVRRFMRRLLSQNSGSQLLEFALVLPMLLVFVVGISDFGGVFNLKHRLSNAAREGARLAVTEGTLDLTAGGTPPSVDAVRQVVSNYLSNAGITQCKISTSASSPVGLSWTFNSSSSGCGTFALVIDRNNTATQVGGTTVIMTHVTITYPYTWTFNKVFGLMKPGSSLTLPSSVSSDAFMQNQ